MENAEKGKTEEKELPKLIIFASGTKDGGGSGFENLVDKKNKKILNADIVAVVSNWGNGGVKERAEKLGIPFEHMTAPYTADKYEELLKKYNAAYVSLSGWLKLVPMKNPRKNKNGLDPAKTINIHPGPLPRFGGAGMYGKHVHEAVCEAFKKGEVEETGPTMHFVTEEFDEGPVIFHKTFKISPEDTPSTIAEKVQKLEHEYQPYVTNLVVNGEIAWDGEDTKSLRLPKDYSFV